MIELVAQAEQTGSPLGFLLPLLLLGGMFYFMILRPQRARQRHQESMLQALEVGDEVMTAGGIFGRVSAIDEDNDTVTVEIAPGTKVRMLRRAIAQRIVEERVDLDETPEEEAGTGS